MTDVRWSKDAPTADGYYWAKFPDSKPSPARGARRSRSALLSLEGLRTVEREQRPPHELSKTEPIMSAAGSAPSPHSPPRGAMNCARRCERAHCQPRGARRNTRTRKTR